MHTIVNVALAANRSCVLESYINEEALQNLNLPEHPGTLNSKLGPVLDEPLRLARKGLAVKNQSCGASRGKFLFGAPCTDCGQWTEKSGVTLGKGSCE